MSKDLTVYMNVLSPYSRTVLMTCSHLGIKHTERTMNVFKKEHKKKWYLEINPKGQIPGIKDGDHCMGESIDICKYLIESRQICTKLYPYSDPTLKAKVDQDITFAIQFSETYSECLRNVYFGPALGTTKSTKEEKKQFIKEVYQKLDDLEAQLEKKARSTFPMMVRVE